MARVDVTQEVVLDRIIERLRSQLALNDRQCYETLDPNSPPAVPTGGEYFLTVAPGDGEFPDGEQAAENITEDWSVTVTAFSRIHLDQTDHDKEVLRNASRGLLAVKKKVLAALVGHDLAEQDTDTFLRQLLYISRCGRPELVSRDGANRGIALATLQLDFGVSFDWDLT